MQSAVTFLFNRLGNKRLNEYYNKQFNTNSIKI